MRKTIIGVMGPGASTTEELKKTAFELGRLIAKKGWVLLNGGRDVGVMDAVSRGAQSENGLTIGILPVDHNDYTSDGVDVAILTDVGQARNNINVLSAHVVIACGLGAGTASEIALALKAKKHVILLGNTEQTVLFYKSIYSERINAAKSPVDAIELAEKILKGVKR